MMDIEQIVQLATLVSALIAAIGLIVGIVVYRRQSNAQVFLEYTKRYAQVMDRFPGDARKAKLDLDAAPPPESEDLTYAALCYLNLCSEEYYLCKTGYLSKAIWRIWEDELKRTLRSPLFRREWIKVKRESSRIPSSSPTSKGRSKSEARWSGSLNWC